VPKPETWPNQNICIINECVGMLGEPQAKLSVGRNWQKVQVKYVSHGKTKYDITFI